jgi:zinc finger SWIM domain-containing protein 3
MKYLRPRHQDTFNNDHTIKPRQIMAIEKSCGNDVSYKQSWRALIAAQGEALGDDIKSFQKIPAFLGRIAQADHSTYYHLESKDGAFHRLFLAPGPTQKAFQYCRRFIAFDGTFWKNRWDLTLLLAVTMDGNDEILPLAWAIVPTESNQHWNFFFKHFKAAFPSVDDPSMTVISDRGKGLESALPEQLPMASYCHCAQHICDNLMKNFHPGAEARKMFWKAVYAPSKELFETHLDQIDKLHATAGEYLRAIPFEMWARYAVKNPRFAHVTSNIVESINSAWLLDVREEPILHALDRIWTIMMGKFHSRHTRKFSKSRDYTDWAQTYINRQSMESRFYKVIQSSAYVFQVTRSGKSSTVDLISEICSCGEFQDLKLPCRHAIASIVHARYGINAYIHEVYMKTTYYKTYAAAFAPINNQYLLSDEECGPCAFKKPKGRPAKNRRQHGKHQYTRENKCSVCKQEGHNRRSTQCPGYGTRVYVLPQSGSTRTWKHRPAELQDTGAEWMDPTRHGDIGRTPPPLSGVVQTAIKAINSAPASVNGIDPTGKGRWTTHLEYIQWMREEDERMARESSQQLHAEEEAHDAYLADFVEKNRRIPTLQEDQFSRGLQMFTNRLVPARDRIYDVDSDGDDEYSGYSDEE